MWSGACLISQVTHSPICDFVDLPVPNELRNQVNWPVSRMSSPGKSLSCSQLVSLHQSDLRTSVLQAIADHHRLCDLICLLLPKQAVDETQSKFQGRPRPTAGDDVAVHNHALLNSAASHTLLLPCKLLPHLPTRVLASALCQRIGLHCTLQQIYRQSLCRSTPSLELFVQL